MLWRLALMVIVALAGCTTYTTTTAPSTSVETTASTLATTTPPATGLSAEERRQAAIAAASQLVQQNTPHATAVLQSAKVLSVPPYVGGPMTTMLCATYTVTNTGQVSYEVIPTEVEAITASGQIVPAQSLLPPGVQTNLLAGIVPGGTFTGNVCFDIGPTGRGTYTLTFTSFDGAKSSSTVRA